MPLIALQYHEVKVNIQFTPLSQLLVKTAQSGGSSGTVTVSGGSLGYASLWVDYVYLDTDERRRFAQVSHEYLIEQLQFTGGESVSQNANKIRLNFNHPVKELIWAVVSNVNTAANDDFNYTATDVHGNLINPVVSGKLQLNGHDRFDERLGSYFNLVQPYQHHTNIPKSVGINVYSFGLKPEEHQPSGTCNFSRIDNATLNLTMQPGFGGGVLNVYAPNYNVLRIMSGINLLCQRAGCPQGTNRHRLVRIGFLATLPNCGKVPVLYENSSPDTIPCGKPQVNNRVNDLDVVKALLRGIIRSQAPKSAMTGYGEGSETRWKCVRVGLSTHVDDVRYSPSSWKQECDQDKNGLRYDPGEGWHIRTRYNIIYTTNHRSDLSNTIQQSCGGSSQYRHDRTPLPRRIVEHRHEFCQLGFLYV